MCNKQRCKESRYCNKQPTNKTYETNNAKQNTARAGQETGLDQKRYYKEYKPCYLPCLRNVFFYRTSMLPTSTAISTGIPFEPSVTCPLQNTQRSRPGELYEPTATAYVTDAF